jgi:hypothetical protein
MSMEVSPDKGIQITNAEDMAIPLAKKRYNEDPNFAILVSAFRNKGNKDQTESLDKIAQAIASLQ